MPLQLETDLINFIKRGSEWTNDEMMRLVHDAMLFRLLVTRRAITGNVQVHHDPSTRRSHYKVTCHLNAKLDAHLDVGDEYTLTRDLDVAERIGQVMKEHFIKELRDNNGRYVVPTGPGPVTALVRSEKGVGRYEEEEET